MRIGVLSHSGCGGSSVIACELAMSLAPRHEVHLLTYHRPYFLQALQLEGIHTVVSEPISCVGALQTEWTEDQLERYEKLVLKVVKEQRIDLLHVHYAVPFLSIVKRVKAVLKERCPKIVLTFHGTDVSYYGEDPLWQRKIQEDSEVVDCFTTVSRDYAAIAQRRFQLQHTPELIPNFISSDHQRGQPRALPSHRPPRLIHVSNFRKVKNIPGLIEIYDKIRSQMPVDLWLVGDGPCFPEIKALIEARDDANRIRMFGATHDVSALLEQCELFMLCSRAESFSRSAIEAANQGVPSIAPSIPGLRDTVIHEQTGLLFPPNQYDVAADLACRLLSSPHLYGEYSQNCLTHANRFDTQAVSKQYERLFASLMGRTL